MEHIKVLKSKVHLLTVQSLHQQLKCYIHSDKKATVDYLNIYSANLAYENEWFEEFINSCDIVLCDGKGIQLAAKLASQKVPEQIAYNRWLWDFFSFCEKEKFSIFFLGSQPDIVARAMLKISEKGHKIRMSGHHGYFDKTYDGSKAVIDQINAFEPDFLLIGFGMPMQEKWVLENRPHLKSKVIILGGAYLDWISGAVATTPPIISKLGLEWLYRLLREPKRMYRRYLIGIPQFFFRLSLRSSRRI